MASAHLTSRPPGAGLDVTVETKLNPPRPREQWLERGELIQYLSDTSAKLILVDAPAGFGKTTLVAQWRARLNGTCPFAWISLDRGDNDPVRLWRHVVSALERACREFASSGILPPPAGNVPDLAGTVLPALVNRLAALSTPVVLALDDYHVIKERSCHEQMEFLLLHLPSTMRIVIITRADPPLPLARLRAAGDMAEVRARELRFTAADVAALVHAVASVRPSDADVADLVQRTEGWPAGVYLAALSIRDSPSPHSFIRHFTGNHRFIVDFLAEEVMSRQPAEVRRFLIRTSVLSRFTAPLCDTVAGVPNGAEVIAHLEQQNLFLVPLDDDRLWYRYHHLFAQMLRSQLAQAEPGIVPVLHARASAWHQEQGSAEEAIEYALSGGDISQAADLIARHWYRFVSAGRAATVREWIRSLGDEWIGKNPTAAHFAAWIAAVCGDRDSACRWLSAIEAGQHEGPLPDGMRSPEFSAALMRGTFGFDGLLVMRESAETAVGLETNPESPWFALARTAFGFTLYLCGEPGAAAALQQAVLSETTVPLGRMLALAVAALVAAQDGRMAQAQELARAARQIAGSAGLRDAPQSSFVDTATGVIHARQGRLEEARTDLERAIRSRRRWLGMSPWPTADALLHLAAVLLDLGDRRRAAAHLAEVRDVLTSLPDGTSALQARLNRLERRLVSASWGTPLTEPLTEREEAVLRLLRGTLSLREIGRELYLSANTIKTHTRAIYRKLGVSTRSQAVERARELRILF